MATMESTTTSTASKDGSPSSLAPRPAEMKLAPGIYFTPSRSSTTTSSSGGGGGGKEMPPAPNVDDMTREELEFEYRSIAKSVEKLGESNDLMKKFDAKGEDQVLIDAIRENTDIIIRNRLRLVAVKARLDHLIRSQPHIKPSRPNALAERIAAAATNVTITQPGAEQVAEQPNEASSSSSTDPSHMSVTEPSNEPDVLMNEGMDL